MSVSDIVTLVSLIIAIVAILNEKNRTHLLLKFHWVDYCLLGIAFLLINYFTFYDSFYARGFYLKQLYFQSKFTFSHPQNWAYVLSIGSLLFILWKMLWAHYPSGNGEKVMKYYKRLIEINEISLLLDIIERYHKRDIIKLIRSSKDFDPERIWWKERFRRISTKEKIQKSLQLVYFKTLRHSWYNRRSLAFSTLHGIFSDPAFIALAVGVRPYLFADIIAEFKEKKRDNFPQGFAKAFLRELVDSKNFWLKKELLESQNNDFGQPEWFRDQNRILSSLFEDLSVAKVNEVWQAFGDSAIDEIKDERSKGYNSKMFEESRGKLHLWEFRTMYSIQFFKVLIIEALIKRYEENHFFLFYYQYITRDILVTFEKYPPEDETENIYLEFIEIMISNVFLWLGISNEKGDRALYYNILDCLGLMIEELCESDEISTEKKQEVIDRLLSHYCGLHRNDQTNNYREKVKEILLKPTRGMDRTHPYYTFFSATWTDFDKIPHRSVHGDYDYFIKLKDDIITPLGLNPNLY